MNLDSDSAQRGPSGILHLALEGVGGQVVRQNQPCSGSDLVEGIAEGELGTGFFTALAGFRLAAGLFTALAGLRLAAGLFTALAGLRLAAGL